MLLNAPFLIDATPSITSVKTITVPAGKVSSDLTDYPLMIDLSTLPSDFWSTVRTDGGNIRAYAADGVTLIPHDVTYINKARLLGRMFVKRTLASASSTSVVLKVLSSGATALAATDPNGRNAVWSDYEVVWVFPNIVNRTGKSHTQDMAEFLPHSEYVRVDYDSLVGSPHNGICTDGTHFISADNIALRRMNMSYAVQQTIADINTVLNPQGIFNLDHIGDPVCVGASFFFTATDTSTTYRRWLVKLKTSDMSFEAAWEMTGAQRVFGATVCYDGTNLLLFSYTDGSKFIKYTTAGAYLSDVPLATSTVGIQGSTVMPSGNIFISYDPATIKEITPSGGDVGTVYTDPHANIMQGLDNRSGNLWLLKGDGALITLRNDVHQDYRYLHQGDRVYATLPNSQIWSMGVTSYQVRTDFQYTYIGIDDPANTLTSTLTGILYDEGAGLDRMGIWNSSDLWLYASPFLTPVAYDTVRMAMAHNGTTERKVRLRRGATSHFAVDAGISARPTGTTMDFLLNTSQRGSNEDGAGYYQFAWLRTQYLSDAWFTADMENWLSPSTFYTVT